jgi:pullulanase/glycogen debranching enzyme
VTNFSLPDVRDLVIYELHIRDFVASDAIKDVTAKTRLSAIAWRQRNRTDAYQRI